MTKEYRANYEIVNTNGRDSSSHPFKGEPCLAILNSLNLAKVLSLTSGDENGPTRVYIGPVIMRDTEDPTIPAKEINLRKAVSDLPVKPDFGVYFEEERAYVESTLAEQLASPRNKRQGQEGGLGILIS